MKKGGKSVRLKERVYEFAAVRLNLDVELRYRAVHRALRPLVAKGSSVLEVGAGAVTIGRYLKCRTTAVDTAFGSVHDPKTERVSASACALPFPDGAWDVVCSIDMLEHIPPARRAAAIAEMVRVGKNVVAVALPVGDEAFKEDIWTHEYYIRQHGKPHRYAKDHVELGLPDRKDIEFAFREAAARTGRNITLKIVPNLNLNFRHFYMKYAFKSSVLGRALYVGMFPLAFCGSILDLGSCYRNIFIGQFER
jgi:ubiquinone/menaquinone biosynthesis C-methylase UbiE